MTKNMELDLGIRTETPQLKNKHKQESTIQYNRICNWWASTRIWSSSTEKRDCRKNELQFIHKLLASSLMPTFHFPIHHTCFHTTWLTLPIFNTNSYVVCKQSELINSNQRWRTEISVGNQAARLYSSHWRP